MYVCYVHCAYGTHPVPVDGSITSNLEVLELKPNSLYGMLLLLDLPLTLALSPSLPPLYSIWCVAVGIGDIWDVPVPWGGAVPGVRAAGDWLSDAMP